MTKTSQSVTINNSTLSSSGHRIDVGRSTSTLKIPPGRYPVTRRESSFVSSSPAYGHLVSKKAIVFSFILSMMYAGSIMQLDEAAGG